MNEGMWSDFERGCMALALEVAESGQGQVSPNPPVGCVLAKDGEVIASGWHDHLGDLHAEQAAIADAETRGVPTQGATAFVTLEPCNHHGRTPPCTEALMWAGIKRVVVAAEDPNPTVRGGGIAALKQAGLVVKQGLMEAEARQQMNAFMHWCANRRPLVILKAALDSNGNVDSARGKPARFTSPESLDEVHRLRRLCDAVLVGVGTVVRDDPKLNVRRVEMGAASQPLRVVLDRNLRTPKEAIVVTDGGSTLILHCEGEGGSVPCETMLIPPLFSEVSEGVDLVQLLDLLGDREVQRLLVEGGPNVWGRFLDAGLVDEAWIFHSSDNLQDGIEGGVSDSVLSNAGLIQEQRRKMGDDTLIIWRR